jgi:hypothetical protein
MPTKIKKKGEIQLEMQLDLLEDIACGRVVEEKRDMERVRKEVSKIVPENYRIAVMPMWFSYTDCERIRRVVGEKAQEFIVSGG